MIEHLPKFVNWKDKATFSWLRQMAAFGMPSCTSTATGMSFLNIGNAFYYITNVWNHGFSDEYPQCLTCALSTSANGQLPKPGFSGGASWCPQTRAKCHQTATANSLFIPLYHDHGKQLLWCFCLLLFHLISHGYGLITYMNVSVFATQTEMKLSISTTFIRIWNWNMCFKSAYPQLSSETLSVSTQELVEICTWGSSFVAVQWIGSSWSKKRFRTVLAPKKCNVDTQKTNYETNKRTNK